MGERLSFVEQRAKPLTGRIDQFEPNRGQVAVEEKKKRKWAGPRPRWRHPVKGDTDT